MFRKIASVVAGASMLMSSVAYAADTTSSATEEGALAPGSAAGIHEAQGMDMDVTMGLLAAAVVITGIVLVVTNTGNGGHSTTATSS